jgi:hypothetical protein
MVGQLVADMLMQVFIERGRRISQEHGYSPLILCGGGNHEFKYLDERMGNFYGEDFMALACS